MWWIISAVAVMVLTFVLRRNLVRNPGKSAAAFGGLLSVLVLWQVFKADKGYSSTPVWIILLALVVVFVWGVRLFSETVDKMWPREKRGDSDVQ